MNSNQSQDTLQKILQTLIKLNTNMQSGFKNLNDGMKQGFDKMNDGLDEVRNQVKSLSKKLDPKIKKKSFLTDRDSNSPKSRKIYKQPKEQKRREQIVRPLEPQFGLNNREFEQIPHFQDQNIQGNNFIVPQHLINEEIVNEVMIEQPQMNQIIHLNNEVENLSNDSINQQRNNSQEIIEGSSQIEIFFQKNNLLNYERSNSSEKQKNKEQVEKKQEQPNLNFYFKKPERQEKLQRSQNSIQSHSDEENTPNDQNN